jgi:hypothetical protein
VAPKHVRFGKARSMSLPIKKERVYEPLNCLAEHRLGAAIICLLQQSSLIA